MNEIYLNIIIWAIIWSAVLLIFFFVLAKRGITYTQRYGYMAFYFFAASVVSFLVFKNLLMPVVESIDWTPALVIFTIVFLVTVLVYAVLPRYFSRPDKLISNAPHSYFLLLDYRYLFTKIFEILFQQILVAALVLLLQKLGLNFSQIIVVFAILFTVAHAPAIKIEGKFMGWLLTIFGFLAAFIFPLFILKLPGGLAYSFIFHWGFYTLLSVFFWVLYPKLFKYG